MGFIRIIIFLLLSVPLKAQDADALLKDAQKLETSFREADALQQYLQVLRLQPSNVAVLCKVSELYNVLGKRQASKDVEKQYYRTGKVYAEKALSVNPNYSDANFVMAMAMGRMSLISSGSEKIKAVKEIKYYAERCIQLDPNNYKGYHVLGKWHYEVSDLNSLERWLVKVTYGSLPQSSLDQSIYYYEKCGRLNPSFVLNYLELAKAYKRKDENAKAISLLTTMLKLPSLTGDDARIKAEGKKMLEELK
jgi:tetratricopeptide (TPR) repeat protein